MPTAAFPKFIDLPIELQTYICEYALISVFNEPKKQSSPALRLKRSQRHARYEEQDADDEQEDDDEMENPRTTLTLYPDHQRITHVAPPLPSLFAASHALREVCLCLLARQGGVNGMVAVDPLGTGTHLVMDPAAETLTLEFDPSPDGDYVVRVGHWLDRLCPRFTALANHICIQKWDAPRSYEARIEAAGYPSVPGLLMVPPRVVLSDAIRWDWIMDFDDDEVDRVWEGDHWTSSLGKVRVRYVKRDVRSTFRLKVHRSSRG